MISALRNLVRFQLKAVSFADIRDAFSPQKIVQGRILQQVDRGVFVLRTQGMNLVAEATVPLQVGDFVTTRVKKQRDKIELKLLAVNGRPVEDSASIPVPDFRYARLPLPAGLFGRNSLLEIYDFEKKNENGEFASEEVLRFQLVLNTSNEGLVLIKVFRVSGKDFYRIYATNRDFYRNLSQEAEKLVQWFLRSGEKAGSVQILFQPEGQLFETSPEASDVQRLNLRA